METITEEEEIKEEKSGIRERIEKDDDKMDNIVDPYYELQENSLGQGNLRERQCHNLAKWLSHYLYFFSFLFLFFYLGLTIQKGVWESVTQSQSHDRKVTVSHQYDVT